MFFLYAQSSRWGSTVVSSPYSQATSPTRHMLADMSLRNDSTISDDAGLCPSAPFVNNTSRDSLSALALTTHLSLSVNYIPSKFSGFRNRRRGEYSDQFNLPKQGGGLQAFRTNEARMPQGKRRLRWNKFKWVLLFANFLVRLFFVFYFFREPFSTFLKIN